MKENSTLFPLIPKDILTVIFLILAYGILFSCYTLTRHSNFFTYAFDLGIFNQALWKFIHHAHMITTIERIPPVDHFAVHFSPILYLLAPFYWLYSKPQTLLILQSFIIGSAALPIYLIAKNKTNNIKLSLVIACTYFIYPGIFYLNRYDFHELAFTVPLLLLSLYYLEVKNTALFCVFLLLAFLTKEDVAICGVGIGMYALWAKKQRMLGLLTIVVSLVYFLLVVKILIPMIGYPYSYSYTHRYRDLIPAGKGYEYILVNALLHPLDIFKYIFCNPLKLFYLFALLLPVAFFPVFNGLGSLVILLPCLSMNLLSSYLQQYFIFWQYSAMNAVFIYFLTILGAQNIINFFAPLGSALDKTVNENKMGQDTDKRALFIAIVCIFLIIVSVIFLSSIPSADVAISIILANAIFFMIILGGYNIVVLISYFANAVPKTTIQKREKITQILIHTLIASSLFCGLFQGVFISIKNDYTSIMEQKNRTPIAQQMINAIPLNASVSARKNLVPHLSSRENVFDFQGADVNTNGEYASSDDGPNIRDAEYILFDTKLMKGDIDMYRLIKLMNIDLEESSIPTPTIIQLEQLVSILKQKKYGVVEYKDRYLLLKKNYNAQFNMKVAADIDKYLADTMKKVMLEKTDVDNGSVMKSYIKSFIN